jgi:hypothetical protein
MNFRRRLFVDAETDGLLDTLTKIHSLVLKDVDTGERWSLHGPEIVTIGLPLLAEAGMIVGHNIIKFDLLALKKVHPQFTYNAVIVDTLVLSKLIYSDIKNQADYELHKKGKLPGNMVGRHGLEA